jgi:hypothetical protein
MFLFDDKFEIQLNISHRDFIDNLLRNTELRDTLENDLFPNKKVFLGQIEFNSFKIVPNKSGFNSYYPTIIGNIINENDLVKISCSIKGYKGYFIFILPFIAISIAMTFHYGFFVESSLFDKIFFSFLSALGLFKFISSLYRLEKYKIDIIKKIKELEKVLPKR